MFKCLLPIQFFNGSTSFLKNAKSCTLWCTQVSFWYRRIDAILCWLHCNWSTSLFATWHSVTGCVHFDSNCEGGSRKHLYNVVRISWKMTMCLQCNVVTLVLSSCISYDTSILYTFSQYIWQFSSSQFTSLLLYSESNYSVPQKNLFKICKFVFFCRVATRFLGPGSGTSQSRDRDSAPWTIPRSWSRRNSPVAEAPSGSGSEVPRDRPLNRCNGVKRCWWW